MTARLRLIEGRHRAPTPCGRPSWECDEARAEIVCSRAERLAFTSQVRHHALWAAHGLATGIGDAERHMTALLRLAAREQARAQAVGIDDAPPALAIARAA